MMIAPVVGSGCWPACRHTVANLASLRSFIEPQYRGASWCLTIVCYHPRFNFRMASDAPPHVMPAPPPAPFHPFRSLPGRLLLLSGVSLIVLWLVSQVVTLPPLIEAFRKVASFAVRVSLLWLAVLIVIRNRQHFLWRVRRKLILSYVFLGFVPVVLIVVFASVGAVILHGSTAAYLFNGGIEDLMAEVSQVAATAAAEIGVAPIQSEVVITRQY